MTAIYEQDSRSVLCKTPDEFREKSLIRQCLAQGIVSSWYSKMAGSTFLLTDHSELLQIKCRLSLCSVTDDL